MEALFIRGVLSFLLPDHDLKGIRLQENNQDANSFAENPSSSSNKKHIVVRHHFLGTLVEIGDISISYVGADEQYADISS